MLAKTISILALSFVLILKPLIANAGQSPTLMTNQNYIEMLKTDQPIDVNSTESIFSFVFEQLPEEVTVYPTENYYYYSFHHNGIELSGNIRLDALDRDKGIVHFACFSTFNRWNEEVINHYKKFEKTDGVVLKKIAPLKYSLSYRNKSVIFKLHDLSNVLPPISKIREDEQFIGPVYDESGIQLYLVYNQKIKKFHYILNDRENVPETFTPSKTNKDIIIGTRTGFSFYKDNYKNRFILIGVYSGNSMVNNYYDGPFDQLPDNFIKGDVLKNAFIDQSPELKGKIDRFGNTDHGASRVLITPYIHYTYEQDLSIFSECTNKAGDNIDAYYTCFDKQGSEENNS
ncbi:hypothetical protein TUM19329_02950 [Legionella antarctica]|uniref:Uncharacterized protein n=2 Tax=Legionella antarctica TaxID=2708020 RepID=A0A6F8SZS6_9GAMM|nr:hypothetical protein TUM19329_02950 [Legionella antarctica]